jgi:uncharacterized membrane protein YoaK (UPF0700 family)
LTAVLAAVMLLLALSALFDTAPLPLVLAMGSLNAALHRAGDVEVRLTFVTGALVRLGEGIGDYIAGRAQGWGWAEQALPWIGIVGGAIIAAAAKIGIGWEVHWLPVGLAGFLLLATIPIRSPE